MARSLQSSLSPKRTANLPNVYHRPQEGSGIYLKPENINPNVQPPFSKSSNGKQSPNFRDTRHREYENPNVNLMRAFDTRPTADNFFQVRRFVLALNGFKTHGKDVSHKLAWFAGRFADSLEDCNLCWRCKSPIKVKKSRIDKSASVKTIAVRNPRNGNVQVCEVKQELSTIFKQETPERKRKVQHIRSFGGKQLTGDRVRTVNNISETIYADIPCHYEYKSKMVDGVKRYEYYYVDGTGRNLQPRKDGVKRYFAEVHEDGSETKIDYIPHTYRIQNTKCNCTR